MKIFTGGSLLSDNKCADVSLLKDPHNGPSNRRSVTVWRNYKYKNVKRLFNTSFRWTRMELGKVKLETDQ